MKLTPQTRIGWIGTGVMGRSMAGHLQKAGYPLVVFNRTKDKARDLLDGGATWAGNPREVAEQSEVIFSIVGYPHDVRAVLLGQNGAIEGCRSGSILCEMTTSEPSLAVEIQEASTRRNVSVLDAPVSGGDIGARNATLTFMIGGQAETIEQIRPLLDLMGKNIVHQGPAGAGQHAKLANQILIASTMVGVCECLLYAQKAGLDVLKVIDTLGKGAAGCWSLTNYGPRIVQRNFDPGFYVEHFIKDMGIALAEARRMNLALPGLALAQQLYQATAAQGHAKMGTQSLIKTLRQMAAVTD